MTTPTPLVLNLDEFRQQQEKAAADRRQQAAAQARKMLAGLTPGQRTALRGLDGSGSTGGWCDNLCFPFRTIMRQGGCADRAQVRRWVRQLARKGLAEYHKGLWTEDGTPAGAGYGLTMLGAATLELLHERDAKQ
jgi:hypothetical protein